MARAWLDERLKELLPALQALGTAQEDEVARLCEEEIEHWRARPEITKPSSLRPVMTAARKAIKQIRLTPENRYKNARTGQFEHIALKHLNFSKEEWDELNAIPEEKHQQRLENQQLIENWQEIIARAEKLLASHRWDDLVTGLAIVTGRRLTELLKTGRFFPKSMYTVVFDGQLKRRDLALKPYEIPTLVSAELVLSAWRKLRSLEDCTALNDEQVSQKYSKVASENANRQYAGLIPQRSTKEDLSTHAFRAVYARLAVLLFCPVRVVDRPYVSTILGHYYAKDEKQQRDDLATDHYFDYAIGDGQGNIDGRHGIRLGEPQVQVIEVFQPRKGDQTMNTDTIQALETKPHKTRGTLTTKPGTFDQAMQLMERRNMRRHDELIVDLMSNDNLAHQLMALLEPLASELKADGPVAILQVLIAAYRSGGSAAPGMAELLQDVSKEEKEPVTYLKSLVKRDRDFKTAIAHRHAGTDYSSLPMEQLSKIKMPEAATERFKRAVDAIIAHNNAQQDPLHLWFINAAAVRDLVGGRNDAVQEYLELRKPEIDAHHGQYKLTARQNSKNAKIEEEIIIEPGWKKPEGKKRGKSQDDDEE